MVRIQQLPDIILIMQRLLMSHPSKLDHMVGPVFATLYQWNAINSIRLIKYYYIFFIGAQTVL